MLSRVLKYAGEHFIVFHTIKLQITLKKCRFFTLNGHFGDGLVRSLLTSILFIFTLKNVRQTSRNFKNSLFNSEAITHFHYLHLWFVVGYRTLVLKTHYLNIITVGNSYFYFAYFRTFSLQWV